MNTMMLFGTLLGAAAEVAPVVTAAGVIWIAIILRGRR